MEYKWYDIRKKIVNNCKKTFNEQGVLISETNIEAAIDLFDRVVSYPLHFLAIGNLQVDLQQSLQHAYIDKVGRSADLRNVLTLLDAYLKKILVLANLKTVTELTTEKFTLKPLIKYTGVSAKFNSIKTQINESNIELYKNDPSGAYIFCFTYLARNKVHESPSWDEEDVLLRLRYAMASYILVTHHLSTTIKSNYPNLISSIKIDLSEINETGFVYDFINYGNTTNKIKNRIVESFVLNYMYKKATSVAINDLVKEVTVFSRQSLSEPSIKGLVLNMVPHRLQFINAKNKEVELNQMERTRIQSALESYTLAVERLMSDLENLLDGYGLKEKTSQVYEKLKCFFENNCLSIVKILSEEDGEAGNIRSEQYIDGFKKYLKSIGCADEQTDQLFRDLLHICSLNDILVKIALGKNFTNISNPDSLASGLKQREKKVYLDTQLLLYALCDYDEYFPYKGSPSFIIVKSLTTLARQNPLIKLATISQYVNEAAYHLKRALQLITVDDFYHDSRIKLSDNVFYSYYYNLKDNGQLNEGIDTLSDFLKGLFNVDYDDLLQGNFEQNMYDVLKQILEDDYGIVVEEPSFFSDEEINNSEKIFQKAILSKNDNRSPIAVRKDAIMGLHLFNSRNICAPFFLSWDKAFAVYRKDYIKLFQRHTTNQWLLFGPAKFVNHLNLLDMRIDVDVLTEDLISIIEDDDTAANTKSVLDSISRLLENSNVNSRQKRKIYSEIIFNETDFPNDTVIPDEKRLKMTTDFATALDKVMSMMQTGSHRFSHFKDIIGDEARFKSIVSSMCKRLEKESIDECASATFEELLKEIEATEDKENKD